MPIFTFRGGGGAAVRNPARCQSTEPPCGHFTSSDRRAPSASLGATNTSANRSPASAGLGPRTIKPAGCSGLPPRVQVNRTRIDR